MPKGKPLYLFLFIFLLLSFTGCANNDLGLTELANFENTGFTVFERFPAPKGFQKQNADAGSWEAYLQQFALLKQGSQVLDYTGKPISDQKSHAAVLDIDVGRRDLQQCADAIIRLRAEYLWKAGRKDQINFKFTSGHAYSWSAYAEGIRPEVNGNKVTFNKTAPEAHLYDSFRKYLDIIFTFAGTISLHRDMKTVERKSEYKIGDVLVHPGSPGHAIVIVDKAKNWKGESIYLLAQGYTPAMSVHIVKSGHSGVSPWFRTPTTGPVWHKRFNLSKVGIRSF